MLFVVGLQPAQDLDRVLDRRLVDVDLLEPADERPVLLEIVPVFLVGGRADAAQLAAGERRLQQVRRVHGTARCGAGADDRMDLVDEQHRALGLLELGHHGLEPFLEVAAIACAGEQCAHIEREDRGIGQDLGHITFDDTPGQALGDGRLADPGITHIKRVVLGPPGENLDRALNLGLAPDQRVDVTILGLLVEVDTIGAQRLLPLLDTRLAVEALFVGAVHGPVVFLAGHLGDAVRDIIHRIKTGHLLLLQEINRVAFAFRENGDQHIRARDLFAAGRLDMDCGALKDTLEPGRRLGFLRAAGDQARELLINILREIPAQVIDIDTTGPQHGDRILVFGQREQEMLERCVFVMPLVGERQCTVKRLFQILRQHLRRLPSASGLRHPVQHQIVACYSFSSVHCNGCSCLRAKSITCVTLVSATS